MDSQSSRRSFISAGPPRGMRAAPSRARWGIADMRRTCIAVSIVLACAGIASAFQAGSASQQAPASAQKTDDSWQA